MDLICSAFNELEMIGGGQLQFLQGHKDNTFTVADIQGLDGAGIIKLAHFGSLYLLETGKTTPVQTTESASSSSLCPILPTPGSDKVGAFHDQVYINAHM